MKKSITSRWWFYILLLGLTFMIPPYSQIKVSPNEISNVISTALRFPLSSSISALFPIAKLLLLCTLIVPFLIGEKAARIVAVYSALSMFLIGIFQSIAVTKEYGFVWIIGNTIIMSLVGVFWIMELIKPRNNFAHNNLNKARLWVLPLMVLAMIFPLNFTQTGELIWDFSIKNIMLNESATAYCLVTPTILGILILFFPNINIELFRVSSFVGLIFGILNCTIWFVFSPELYLMGILHLPLLILSLYGCGLSLTYNKSRKLLSSEKIY
ncbi:MAG: hypothetical protein AB2417_20160 [Clostridiaceae bacterium]